MNYLLGKALAWLGQRLDGYKTKIGGAGLVMVGIAGVIGRMFPDQGLPAMDVTEALEAIAGGITVIGLAGKAEKIKAALSPSSPAAGDLPQGPQPPAGRESDELPVGP